jgi:hypothetical protein
MDLKRILKNPRKHRDMPPKYIKSGTERGVNQNTLKDFIYLDIDRVRSFTSQLFEGIPETSDSKNGKEQDIKHQLLHPPIQWTKKTSAFLSEISNHKIQISNNIKYQNSNDKNTKVLDFEISI